MTPMPTNVAPGVRGGFLAIATNVGAQATSGTVTFTITVPAGLTPSEIVPKDSDPPNTTWDTNRSWLGKKLEKSSVVSWKT
jgi:hypothetical protein